MGSRAKGRAVAAEATRRIRERRLAEKRQPRLNTRTGGFLGIEKKFVDYSVVGSTVAMNSGWASCEYDPATVNQLCGVAQGDGESQRDGKNYIIKDLMISGTFEWYPEANQTAGEIQPQVFWAIVLDTQTNATQLNSEDVYNNPGADGSTNCHPLRDLQYSSRFKVLKKGFGLLPVPSISFDGTNIEANGTTYRFKAYLKNLNIKVETKGTTANVTEFTKT